MAYKQKTMNNTVLLFFFFRLKCDFLKEDERTCSTGHKQSSDSEGRKVCDLSTKEYYCYYLSHSYSI